MDVQFLPDGIWLPALDLWLDPEDDKPTAFLSHGHADHVRGAHREVLCTAATSEIYALRGGHRAQRRALAFGETVAFRGARLTLFPAGHLLGAAQLLVEQGGERFVYTGDWKLDPPLCADAGVVVPCDHLVIESTFGLPIFRFLDASQARRRIVEAAREALAEGDTPVFLGYPLGRSQEIVEVLTEADVPVAVHGGVGRYLDLYRRHTGRRFEAVELGADNAAGRAVVGPSPFGRTLAASLDRPRVVAVSGWALLDSARERFGADVLIAYSGHAGFDELLRGVAQSGARRVDVVHGFAAPFASILRARGVDARAPAAVAAPVDPDEVAS